MKISCIIPTYNRSELLLEALSSVCKQSVLPFEIILINNGENKLSLPNDLLSRVTVYDIVPHAGVSQARNFGAVSAKGDYLAFLDDDDLWSEDYLLNVKNALSDESLCVVSRLDILHDGNISRHKNALGKLTLKKLLVSNPGVTGSNIVISRKLFFDIGGFDSQLSISEDKSLIIEIIRRNIPIKVLPDNQAILREHRGIRLFNPEKLADGTYFFVRKYYTLMDTRAKLINWQKIYHGRYLRGGKLSFLPYIILAIIRKIIRI